ncbi:lipopolysaccharide kinase InaA family protein [Urbifossiella limnaea]|uniref:3-deoxy-D-manno-octulosonic-acid kinase n=1 Tax=Urbifossiella limnaea TaxID=2528023 RepID=A0A517XY67_9BACT|nr:lipopolysaccharide kinase InaA family protein [Urbifossiella limnaea]QDU22455.1 3-deoxy-D-manno-octulosonic-acid kinase [Urbifossiella limnaea]
MPPSVLEAPARAAGWVEVHPDFADRLEAATATELLELPGEVVSGHPDRHVVRVELPGWERPLYLKRQHRVTWKERFRQWRAGFGWRSRCGREAELLKQLAAAGLPAPRWVAHGEDGRGRAFLLVEELSDAVELRQALHPDAGGLGRAVAALHDAGFDTPDLTAKHVFIGEEVTLIDWQSAHRGPAVAVGARLRAIAALHASLADYLATPRERLRFLRAYSRAANLPIDARAVERLATTARQRRSIRDQRQPVVTAVGQRLVWLAGEAVCAVPAVAETWPRPAVCAPFYGDDAGIRRVTLPDGRPAELVTGTSFSPAARFRAWLRGRPWRSPGATLGRVLFHLERYGLPAPRLLAFGQRLTGPASADWFALYEPPAGQPLADWLATSPSAERREAVTRQCERLTTQLRDASCEPAGPVFWVDADGRVTVGGVRHVRIVRG